MDTGKAQYIVEINDAENPNKVQVWYEADNDDDTYVASTTDIEPGSWHFFAATRNEDGTINVYLDGELETTTEQPVPQPLLTMLSPSAVGPTNLMHIKTSFTV